MEVNYDHDGGVPSVIVVGLSFLPFFRKDPEKRKDRKIKKPMVSGS